MDSYSSLEEVWGLRAGDDDGEDEVLAPGSALDTDLESDDEPVEDVVDDGFQDPDGIVRLWFDGDDLTRVRISSRWRSKLGSRTLDDCFSAAIMMANMRVAEVKPRPTRSFNGVDFTALPPLSARSMTAFQRLFDDLERRWDEAQERHGAQPLAQPAPATGRSQGVTAELGPAGRIARVSFDARWLENAQPRLIGSQVMRAWRQARARHTPAEDDRAELDAVETEHQLLTAAFEAMLSPARRSSPPSLQTTTESTGDTP